MLPLLSLIFSLSCLYLPIPALTFPCLCLSLSDLHSILPSIFYALPCLSFTYLTCFPSCVIPALHSNCHDLSLFFIFLIFPLLHLSTALLCSQPCLFTFFAWPMPFINLIFLAFALYCRCSAFTFHWVTFSLVYLCLILHLLVQAYVIFTLFFPFLTFAVRFLCPTLNSPWLSFVLPGLVFALSLCLCPSFTFSLHCLRPALSLP